MTDLELKRIVSLTKERYGIDMTGKKEIVEGRMANMLRKEGWETCTDFLNAMEMDKTGSLEKVLVNLLTTNHTYFMREFEHLEFLRQEILPYLKDKERNSRDLRIWCGAASSGEEPYMIAMTLLEFFGFEHKSWDTKVLATDISTEVLETAMRGIYPKEAIEALPVHWKRRFFLPLSGTELYQATEELKNEVLFRQFNLMENFPFRRSMHVVFLRNVMIYFDQPTRQNLIRKIYNLLEPGGYFIVGKTETIDRDIVPFEMIRPSIFRKPL